MSVTQIRLADVGTGLANLLNAGRERVQRELGLHGLCQHVEVAEDCQIVDTEA